MAATDTDSTGPAAAAPSGDTIVTFTVATATTSQRWCIPCK